MWCIVSVCWNCVLSGACSFLGRYVLLLFSADQRSLPSEWQRKISPFRNGSYGTRYWFFWFREQLVFLLLSPAGGKSRITRVCEVTSGRAGMHGPFSLYKSVFLGIFSWLWTHALRSGIVLFSSKQNFHDPASVVLLLQNIPPARICPHYSKEVYYSEANARIAQLARAIDWYSVGPRFESWCAHTTKNLEQSRFFCTCASYRHIFLPRKIVEAGSWNFVSDDEQNITAHKI